MIKIQVTVRRDGTPLSKEEIEKFAEKMGRENVQFLGAPPSVNFWSPLPILRLVIGEQAQTFCGDEAREKMESLQPV